MTNGSSDQPSDRSEDEPDQLVVRLKPTPKFIKSYKNLPVEVRERVDAALRRFLENPRYPGLHFEKLKGSVYRTIRPDRGKYRIVLRDLNDGEYEIADVDRHAVVDRKYG